MESFFRPSELQLPPPESGEAFENLCLSLYREEFGEAQKNGRSGQKQNGVDIFASGDIGIQCKKRELKGKITEKELRAETEKAKKFKPPLKKFILAASCERDADIQEKARIISAEHKKEHLFSVEIHSWDEIKALLDKYSKVCRKYPDDESVFFGPKRESGAQLPLAFSSDLISAIQSESSHSELNRIRDWINEHKPETALNTLKKFKKEKWDSLGAKEKYRVLSLMGGAELAMGEARKSSSLFIQALQFNPEDETANINSAMAYLLRNNIKKAKKHVKKTLKLNPENKQAARLKMQIMEKEGAPLEQIAGGLKDDDLEEEPKTALILSCIATKRREYKKAAEWLDIFGKNRKGIEEEEQYAALSLKIISEREDIKMARRAPDDLKPELEEIKAIYKEFLENGKYSELKKNSPGSFINFAIALELSGEAAEAMEALEAGIKSFPKNNDLKIERSRLLSQKGDFKKEIPILEEMNVKEKLFKALKPPAGENGKASPAEEETKKLLALNFILANLYFEDNQQAAGKSLLGRIIQSPFTDKQDKLEASICLIYGLIRLGDFAAAEKGLDSVFEKNRDNIRILILKSRIEENKGDQDKRMRFLKAACGLAQEEFRRRSPGAEGAAGGQSSFSPPAGEESAGSYFRDILLLSDELYHAKMYEECEPFLEQITNQNLSHPKIFLLLGVYFENGKNQKAIALAKKLLEKFPERPEPAHILFETYTGLGDSKKAIQHYEQFIRKNQKNDLIKINLISACVKNDQAERAKELLKHKFDLGQLPMEYLNNLSISCRQAGNIKKALEIQYRCLKLHPGKPEPREVYAWLIMGFKEEGDLQFLSPPEKAGLNCYVKIKELKTKQEKEIIIEEDADIFTPDHRLSKAVSGKKTNDVFDFSYKKWRVMEIKNKYAHKHHEIMRGSDLDFPSNKFVRSFPIPVNPSSEDMKDALKNLMPDPKKQKEQWDQLIQSYKEGKACIGSFSKITGKHPIEVMGLLIGNQESKFISAFPKEEDYAKAREHLSKKSNMVIDLSALFWLHLIKLEKCLEKSKFRLYICQSTIDSLKIMIQEMALHSEGGLLTAYLDEAGNLGKDFVPPEGIQKNLRFLEKIKAWASEHCQLKPISESFIMSRQRRLEIERSIGKEFLDPLLASHNEKNAALLCEDGVLLGLLSKSGELAASRVRLFDLIDYFESQAVIDSSQAVQFKASLVKYNQFYIPIDHKILLFLLREGKYSANSAGFQRGLYFLGPASFLDGAIEVFARFLKDLFLDSSVLPYHKEIIAKEALDKAFSARRESAKYLAGRLSLSVRAKTLALPIHQGQIQNIIALWLNSRSIRT